MCSEKLIRLFLIAIVWASLLSAYSRGKKERKDSLLDSFIFHLQSSSLSTLDLFSKRLKQISHSIFMAFLLCTK
jgi:hypothetical protein